LAVTVFFQQISVIKAIKHCVPITPKMTMLGEIVVLEARDMLSIPEDTPHSAEVVGVEPVVSLDGIKRL
jgi:hypothetical protein